MELCIIDPLTERERKSYTAGIVEYVKSQPADVRRLLAEKRRWVSGMRTYGGSAACLVGHIEEVRLLLGLPTEPDTTAAWFFDKLAFHLGLEVVVAIVKTACGGDDGGPSSAPIDVLDSEQSCGAQPIREAVGVFVEVRGAR